MTERPKPLAGMFLLAVMLWFIAGLTGLVAAAAVSRPGGGGVIVFVTVIFSLTAFILGVIAAWRAASALDFLVASVPEPAEPEAVTPVPAEVNAPPSTATAAN
ncbi:hypothetical protein ACX8Z9_04560 [Arthrobacter halodurans]|uniref:Uncharacterized protein n=1 Tax=Arthrobacter halodurans TaxID=516699 RepID=A0ABV4UPU6_9MICC